MNGVMNFSIGDTVQKDYKMLKDTHLISPVKGKGFYTIPPHITVFKCKRKPEFSPVVQDDGPIKKGNYT